MALLFPNTLLPVGLAGSVVGISVAAVGILKARLFWVQLSLLDAWLVFFLLLISQAFAQTIGEYLPITLLEFIMILFAVELLTAGSLYQRNPPTELDKNSDPAMYEEFLRRSVQEAFRRVSRAGLLFASCYLLSLGILYLGAFVPPTIPILADISLYVVVVSVALALLILLRED